MSSFMSRCGRVVGSGIGLGLAPVAPATVASLAAVMVYGLSPLDGDSIGFYFIHDCRIMCNSGRDDAKISIIIFFAMPARFYSDTHC